MNAQDINSIPIESVDYLGVKKEGLGECFFLYFEKFNIPYGVILIKKEFLVDSKEVKVIMTQFQDSEPLAVTVSINDKDLVRTERLIAIPYFIIRARLKNTNDIVHPAFMTELYVSEIMPGITEKDVDEVKKVMEKQLAE